MFKVIMKATTNLLKNLYDTAVIYNDSIVVEKVAALKSELKTLWDTIVLLSFVNRVLRGLLSERNSKHFNEEEKSTL